MSNERGPKLKSTSAYHRPGTYLLLAKHTLLISQHCTVHEIKSTYMPGSCTFKPRAQFLFYFQSCPIRAGFARMRHCLELRPAARAAAELVCLEEHEYRGGPNVRNRLFL